LTLARPLRSLVPRTSHRRGCLVFDPDWPERVWILKRRCTCDEPEEDLHVWACPDCGEVALLRTIKCHKCGYNMLALRMARRQGKE